MLASPEERTHLRSRPRFRPNFMLVLVYVSVSFVLFCLAFALPDLVAGLRELPAGSGPLGPEELERASHITANALQGGRLIAAFLAAAVGVGVGIWIRALPGLR